MYSASSYSELLEHLALGGRVVLPNARAARTLRSAFDRFKNQQSQLGLGPTAWEPARAFSWHQFTTGLFHDLVLSGVESRILLNEAQEHHLWRESIAAAQAEEKSDALFSTDSLAELARSAWHTASAYNATHRLSATANTADTRTFALWAAGFIARTKKTDALSPAQLDDALLKHLQQGTLTPPANLDLAAFDDPTPSQSSLLEALRIDGTDIVYHAIEHPQPSSPLRASIIAATERDEVIFAARWIRTYFEHHGNESKSIALLTPSLDDDHAQIDLIFREILAPELESIHADPSSAPWQFATGTTLNTLSIVKCVLELAHWTNAPLSINRISALLLSPFLGVAGDRNLAAHFDASVLRRSTFLRPELDRSTLLALADTHIRSALLPSWLRNFHLQVTRGGSLENVRSFSEWAEFLRGLASAASWPGERILTAAEFEATRAWDSILDLLSTLDFAGRRISFSTFLESLERQARVTNFAGPDTHAPIQVMSVEDAAGSVFDAVVFLRATDTNWPRSPKPNPLLSWHLQQQFNMPGASSPASNAHARSFTQNLLGRSGATLFLSAAEDVSGPLRPASLVRELRIPFVEPEDLVSAPAPLAPLASEAFSDSARLPSPSSKTRGGSRLLKLQAACGFLAFAELRLQSYELGSRSPGFDALESGNFLHKVLQRFWNSVHSQENLRNKSSADRRQLLTDCINAVFVAQPSTNATWDDAYVALQKQRLLNLLNRWLDLELERSPFNVTATEQDVEIEVGPLTLRVRMDRIDRIDLHDGNDGFVFVDYKTSFNANPKNWESPRPDDPQLPLYALTAAPDELQALTFARIRSGQQAEWLGYQSSPGLLPIKTIPDLPQRVDAWRDVLVQLAHAFYYGDTSVSPKDFAQNCKSCAQRLICRLNIETLNRSLDDEDTEGAADD